MSHSNHDFLEARLVEVNDALVNLLSLSHSLGPIHDELKEQLRDFSSCLETEFDRNNFRGVANLFSTALDFVGHLDTCLRSDHELLRVVLKELNAYLVSFECQSHEGSPSESSITVSSSLEDLKRRAIVENTIVSPEQNASSFSDIAGLQKAKQMIRQALILPLSHPNLFNGVAVKPWTRILFFGPPGTGKTELARTIATEMEAVFFSISSSDIVSCMLGESEKIIKDLFDYANKLNRPSVIFIDEIDSLARARTNNEEEHNRRVKTELLVQLSQLERRASSLPPVAFVCATNVPWDIDVGIMRRFQKKIYIPLPSDQARRQLLDKYSKNVGAKLSDEDLVELIDATKGFTPSDIIGYVQDAFFQRVSEFEAAENWCMDCDRDLWVPGDADSNSQAVKCPLSSWPPEVVAVNPPNMLNFRSALSTAKPTVTAELIDRFEEFTQKFGINGE